MRHRTRSHATHEMAVEERTQTGTDAAGEPQYGRQSVLTGERVRYRPAGTAYVRSGSGERVQRSPTVRCRAGLADELAAGMTVTLTPLDTETPDVSTTTFEIVAVNPVLGRRTRPSHTVLELEAH